MHNCFEVCDELKKCNSSLQIFKVMNTYLNNKNIRDKYSIALQKNLKKQTTKRLQSLSCLQNKGKKTL